MGGNRPEGRRLTFSTTNGPQKRCRLQHEGWTDVKIPPRPPEEEAEVEDGNEEEEGALGHPP